MAKTKMGKRGIATISAPTKICSGCGAENAGAVSGCVACGKSRFEPDWVEAHYPLNRQFWHRPGLRRVEVYGSPNVRWARARIERAGAMLFDVELVRE
jgi:hypothetical protein